MALGWRAQYYRYKEFFLNIASFYRQRQDLRAFLEIILSLSTVIVFLLFALKPTALTIIGLVQEIREKRDTVLKLDQKIVNLETAANLLAQNRGSIQTVDNAVSTTPRVDVIAKQIQGLAAKNSVALAGISVDQTVIAGKPAPVKKSTNLDPLPENSQAMSISITARGGYANLLSFLRDFENFRVANKIDILGINASTTESGQIITISISARIPILSVAEAK